MIDIFKRKLDALERRFFELPVKERKAAQNMIKGLDLVIEKSMVPPI